ncbi:ABC transporter ATP-binding protein [Streptococcus mitis]|jgi:sboF|uniref:ATP-binding cassette domain-containing protein n=1 Tax=Streptococcus mitis TaxID=28037 RepID=A0A1X1L8D7_STRMT|nr:ABC transporter ATP-binding protein [Streptococcus mitis]MDU2237325.1 ABC transporter ATP-binding protein [Streptococcus mitis]MDU6549868.1 ABC transporter ATP-binding protein [Streptococcus mitis]MDU7550269.1 ABC transporter ATP-binding protein [Streptococcus mitis]ORP07899.1 bacteriocin [Streptococcus mitis]QKL33825.1 ATP-binding cassette domain-containing protein [Streptococcus mitis]
MISNVLQIKNLQKAFKDTQVVNLSSLSVQQGEIYGFLGPNGAGKTTTMKMILSLISRTAGEIEVFGQSIGTDKQYLNQIGSMIEEPSYYPNLTGYENLLVFQKILGFDQKNIQETLKIVGLDQPKNKKKLVKDYSLGMKQRLALAFALVKKPRLLILDEPTNGLDPAGIHEIRELIIKLAKEQGITVFISTHILSEVEHIADRVGIINHGQLVYEGEIRKIQSNKWLEVRGDFRGRREAISQVLFGYPCKMLEIQEDKLKLTNLADQQISSLLRDLIVEKVPIYEVKQEQETLESIFLNLTKE